MTEICKSSLRLCNSLSLRLTHLSHNLKWRIRKAERVETQVTNKNKKKLADPGRLNLYKNNQI